MVSLFILPWEAARVSMEAQRMIAAQFFGFAFPRSQAERAQQVEEHRVRATDRDNASANSQEPSSGSRQPAPRKAVAARSNAHLTKKATGSRKRKSRAGKRAR